MLMENDVIIKKFNNIDHLLEICIQLTPIVQIELFDMLTVWMHEFSITVLLKQMLLQILVLLESSNVYL